jgi:hypothetical protein
MYKDMDFSIHNNTLTISSKIGIPLNAIFYPSDDQSEKVNNQFWVDKTMLQITVTDLLITNIEKCQDTNESDSLKGHYKDPQIPVINKFVSVPNSNHRPVLL